MRNATVIFTGVVIDVESRAADSRVARVGVLEVLKGHVAEQTEVWSLIGGEGFPFQPGETYLVYAWSWPGEDRLWTSICTRTAEISRAGRDVDALRRVSSADAPRPAVLAEISGRA